MKLEEDFTVVYWDYRDMGIAYDKSFDTDKITLENVLKDTEAVTEYLKIPLLPKNWKDLITEHQSRLWRYRSTSSAGKVITTVHGNWWKIIVLL